MQRQRQGAQRFFEGSSSRRQNIGQPQRSLMSDLFRVASLARCRNQGFAFDSRSVGSIGLDLVVTTNVARQSSDSQRQVGVGLGQVAGNFDNRRFEFVPQRPRENPIGQTPEDVERGSAQKLELREKQHLANHLGPKSLLRSRPVLGSRRANSGGARFSSARKSPSNSEETRFSNSASEYSRATSSSSLSAMSL